MSHNVAALQMFLDAPLRVSNGFKAYLFGQVYCMTFTSLHTARNFKTYGRSKQKNAHCSWITSYGLHMSKAMSRHVNEPECYTTLCNKNNSRHRPSAPFICTKATLLLILNLPRNTEVKSPTKEDPAILKPMDAQPPLSSFLDSLTTATAYYLAFDIWACEGEPPSKPMLFRFW